MNKQTYTRITQTVLLIAAFALLSACTTLGLSKEAYTGGAVHGINYSGIGIGYVTIEDPQDPINSGDFFAFKPYEGSNDTAGFYAYPEKWKPGLQAIVKYQIDWEETYHKVLVTIPPYANNESGDVYILFYGEGDAEVVVCDCNPDSPYWPGRIKGWPVPPKAYLLKIWERDFKRAKSRVENFEKMLLKPGVPEATKAGYQEEIDYYKEDILRLEAHKP